MNKKDEVQIIEKTSKKWKLQMLIAAALAIVGPITCMAGVAGAKEGEPSGAAILGILMFLAGLIWFVTARILAWWHHG